MIEKLSSVIQASISSEMITSQENTQSLVLKKSHAHSYQVLFFFHLSVPLMVKVIWESYSQISLIHR